MADEKVSLHIDDDWKRQAQEEKRRLAEEARQRETSASPAGVIGGAGSAEQAASATGPKAAAAGREVRELPPASLETLVQSIVTQVLFCLGDIAARGQEPIVDLDLAKHHIDTLGVLEQKTRGNLTPEEQRMLDSALYEVRMRYISVASKFADLP